MCGVLEDEHYALLVCDVHYGIRIRFRDKIRWTSVSDMLHPGNEEDPIPVAEYIKAIEKKHGCFDDGPMKLWI